MKEFVDLQQKGIATSRNFTSDAESENKLHNGKFIDSDGTNTGKLAKLTPLVDREFYRNKGYNPSGKNLFEIATELQLPTIYEAPISYKEHYNSHVKALYLDDGTLLDVVRDSWKVIQPIEMVGLFLDYCQNVGLEVEKVGVFKYEKSKENDQGLTDAKQTYSIFISSKLNQDYAVTDKDLITGKLVFKCPYINGQGYTTGITSLRQVCANGLYMPVRLAKKVVSHVGSLKEKQLLDIWKKSTKLWEENKIQNLIFSDTECTELEAVMCLVNCFSTVEQHKQIASQAIYELKHGGSIDAVNTIYFSSFWDKECKIVRECLEMYKKGLYTGYTQGTKSTMWGLLNAVTEYINWNGKQKDSVLSSLLGGSKSMQMLKFQNQLIDVTKLKRQQVEQKVTVSI